MHLCLAGGCRLFIKNAKRPMWHLKLFFFFAFHCVLQEMEKLKEELENMNDLMEQKDTLTQKLEVGKEKRLSIYTVYIFWFETSHPHGMLFAIPGDGAARSGAGGAAGRSGAAAGREPRGAGELQEEPADTAGDAGWQDL